MAKEEGRVLGNYALISRCADSHAVHHAMYIAEIGVERELGSMENGAGRIGEGPVASLAHETLVSSLGLAVLLDINEAAMRTAYTIVEAVLAKELFHRGGVDDFGHLRRHAEHLHEAHLVRLG